jgi:hypothetical protein
MKEKEQMNLNRMIPKAGAAIVTTTVFLFAVFEIINFSMGSFFCLPDSADRVYHDDGRTAQ